MVNITVQHNNNLMPFFTYSTQLTQYYTFTKLLGLQGKDGFNMPPSKELRQNRIQSVQKMLNLIELCLETRPRLPPLITSLDPYDQEWEDKMPFPIIDYSRYYKKAGSAAFLMFVYSYNYNILSTNTRYRTYLWFLPATAILLTTLGYAEYRRQVLKVNLFDEYCWLRAQELVAQNKYMVEHEDFKKYVWWAKDFEGVINKIYRQSNTNTEADFKDSELLLQDFLNRYVDPKQASPM